ncbi:hypothetical protein [Aquibacillus rhizosphaerae]|uniref:Uncharacterized protein n=1 Tax=Aquibacillus rhizosphaerae TaxID=3051431 RepID=A0ABT7L130_9BACI|nr:hypothetical protein [Aquibacillus sp. LR5S19]MDL4839553.1 hypothetical protein [Aquibacillus sp. LR5S19]
MAFGVKRKELIEWKHQVQQGNISFLTHYWIDPRFPGCNTVTKVGCTNIDKLIKWGSQYDLQPNWIHHDPCFPHYDLFGEMQKVVLTQEKQWNQIKRFNI